MIAVARYAVSACVGVTVTFGLLFIMQLMIATGRDALTETQSFRLEEFVRIERNEVIDTMTNKPERPPETEVPLKTPALELIDSFANAMPVSVSAPAVEAGLPTNNSLSFGISHGEYLPIVKVAPVYPARALARRLEGYVLVEFTVTRSGTVENVVVVESTAVLFERPAIEAALKFKYKPRVIDGEPVEVRGVRNRITFTMADS